MRLIYVCRNFSLLGGQARLTWELMQRASREDHEVHMVARRFPKGDNHGLPAGVHDHRVFQWPKFFGPWRFRSFAWFASRKTDALCQKGGLVHGFGDSYRQHILTLGNVDWNYPKYIPGRKPHSTALHIKKAALADPGLRFLVLVSEQMKTDLLDLYPQYDLSKVRVIYPGVDLGRFSSSKKSAARAALSKRFGIPMDPLWIVSGAGGDFDKRNLATLQNALLMLRNRSNWVFVFFGGHAADVCWPQELLNRSFFLGHVEDTSEVIPACDFMVYPAWYDESPAVVLEAQASGLPVVVTRTVGTREILSQSNREMGILETPSDAERLASLIVRFLDDDKLRRKIGQDNQEAARNYSIEIAYQRYCDLYREVEAKRTG